MVYEEEVVSQAAARYRTPHKSLTRSDFIRDLLDLPSDQSIDQAPIHVRQSAKIVRTFVDCATSSHEHDFKVDPTDLVGFADLCDHLQAQTIKSTVLDNLKKQMKSDPYRALGAWNIFKWAAKEADLELARLAITSFDRSDIVVRDLFVERSTTFFDDIPPRYVFALLRSFADPAMNRHGQGGRVHDAIIFRSSIDAANAFTLD